MAGKVAIDKVKLDIATNEKLRRAYYDAERGLTEKDKNEFAEIAKYLREVRDTPVAERDSEPFMHRIWGDENPLGKLGNAELYDVTPALADPDFRRQFQDLVQVPLPNNSSERADRLDDIFQETLKIITPFIHPNNSGHRPLAKTVRAFAALFPHDFTALIHSAYPNQLLKSMHEKGVGGAQEHPARADRRILDRLDDAVGVADLHDWNSVAQRMRMPWHMLMYLRGRHEAEPDSESEIGRILKHFRSIHVKNGLVYDAELVQSLHLGLWAHERRHFAVLTGLSGTGKTQLAVHYAHALLDADGKSNEQLCTIPVQPGWYDPTPLLGYVNPLGEDRYIETEFLRFLIRASENSTEPHVCILDEMNLSHPEQYLAPILSAMERVEADIPLHGGDRNEYGVPPSIRYPRNLVLIGTVNMDETTMGISDKVLDRAFTFEFWDIDVDKWPGWEGAEINESTRAAVKEVLSRLMDALSPARLHFGWRVIAEVVQFMQLRQAQSAELSVDDALDRVIYAKVLPKLRGDDSPRVRAALTESQTVLKERSLERCARKVAELIQDLEETGSFRFWR
jgi:MoxR-like ATPase